MDQETGRSKGYAFFEFSNYKEFNKALNIKEPLIFGKQKLVLNSAKNRFDLSEEETNDDLNRQSSESLNSLNQTLPFSSTETRVSSIRNSKEFNNELSLQIRDSLKKLSEQYYHYDNKPNLFNYYCSPFINNSLSNKELYYVNINKEYINDINLYKKCPFELCEEGFKKK